MNSEGKIVLYEQILGIKFPTSYREFLKQRGAAVVDGFKILGLLTKDSKNWKIKSVLEGTKLVLRRKRPDLPKHLIAICISGNNALCLDLEKVTEGDVPLVEVDLLTPSPPKPLNKTFKQWVEEHEAFAKRFRIAWNRVRARKAEARGKRPTEWKTIDFKVQDYIIGVTAFRYNYEFGCLEVDEFYPINQPHVKRGEPIRVLINEIFSQARDYTGSLKIIFTKDLREDVEGNIPRELQNFLAKRIPRGIPQELVDFAENYGISFKNANEGMISHEEGVELWFSMLELSDEVKKRIYELEEEGYLSREIIAEIVAKGIWSREEIIWIFLNAPRPEALVLGTDLPEDRLCYSESLYWGRAAFLAIRFKQAILSDLAGKSLEKKGISIEEIEEIMMERGIELTLKPEKTFWMLKCNKSLSFPSSWMLEGVEESVEVKANEPVLLLCRPCSPTTFDRDMKWIEEGIDLLSKREEVKHKCLLLSYEFTISTYNPYAERVPELVRKAREKGVHILFAPARMFTFLDEEVHGRMKRARDLRQFPHREEAAKLQITEIPEEWLNSQGKTLRKAFESARIFAEQIAKKREVGLFRKEFSLMCETIEREALQHHEVIVEVDGEESLHLLKALRDDNGISLPLVTKDDMLKFLKKLEEFEHEERKFTRLFKRGLSSFLKGRENIVITVKPYEMSETLLTKTPICEVKKAFLKLPVENKEIIEKEIEERKKCRVYVCKGVDAVYTLVGKSLESGIPFSLINPFTKLRGEGPSRIRSHAFIEVIRDYIYEIKGVKPVELPIVYGDGSEGGAIPLFSLSNIERPEDDEFLELSVSLVSLRHMEVDKLTEMALIRNYEIQMKEPSSAQEDLAFRRVFEKVDGILRFVNGKEEKMSFVLKALLLRKPELEQKQWNGLKLFLYNSTGLEPAVIGAYRAVIELLKKWRGQLIVVPMIYSEGEYRKADEWW